MEGKRNVFFPNQQSLIERAFSNAVQQLTIDDWREIRVGNYWKERDALETDHLRKEYTLGKINEWKRKKKRFGG